MKKNYKNMKRKKGQQKDTIATRRKPIPLHAILATFLN